MSDAGVDGAGNAPGFPLRQLQILLACRLVEPLAVNSIIPYLFAMVKSVSPPDLNDVEATKLVALIFSAYSFAQFGTNILWGRLSDRVGRRPVMLFGLAGVLVCTVGFAFSRSVAAMFVFRIAAGLISGNVVITRTMIGDMVHGRENKARAFAWNQTAYQIGTVVGPFIGGYLVEPCTEMPGLCEGGRFAWLAAYPFALPNILIAACIGISWAVGYVYLNETLVDRKNQGARSLDETSPLLENSYESLPSSASVDKPHRVFTSEVVHVCLSYSFMALHSICFDQMFPVFMAAGLVPAIRPQSTLSPTTTTTTMTTASTQSTLLSSLLHPHGGLGYASTLVAGFVSASGLLSIALMVALFPPVDTYFGSLYCLRASQILYPLIYALIPYLVLLPVTPAWLRLAGVTVIFLLKTVAAVFSFNDNSILLNAAAPSPQDLGLVNGVAQTAANGARALGPAVMGYFIGLGDRNESNAFGWWFIGVVAVVGAVQGFWVSDEKE